MHRCVICDYSDEEGSEYADKAPTTRNKVTWVESEQGFLCTDCRTSIKNTVKTYDPI